MILTGTIVHEKLTKENYDRNVIVYADGYYYVLCDDFLKEVQVRRIIDNTKKYFKIDELTKTYLKTDNGKLYPVHEITTHHFIRQENFDYVSFVVMDGYAKSCWEHDIQKGDQVYYLCEEKLDDRFPEGLYKIYSYNYGEWIAHIISDDSCVMGVKINELLSLKQLREIKLKELTR